MKNRFLIVAFSLSAPAWVVAQNMSPEPQEDPVQRAIREFNDKDSKKANEVTVDITKDEDSGKSPAKPAASSNETPKTEEKPVLVTGTAPEGSELVKEGATGVAPAEAAPAEATMAEPPPPAPQKGVSVRVEKLQSGSGIVDPTKIKLLAPFPAKPIAPAPAGWRLEDSESAPPFTREVELSPGKKITLKVKPHVLVPDSDGVQAFTVMEPGYNPSLGYGQDATVGAVLSRSIRQLDEDSKQLGTVVDHLQQLLVSLPKPEPRAEPVVDPPKNTNTHKR